VTLRILGPWLLMIAVASGGFSLSLRQKRTLKLTCVYLAYCATVGSIQLAFWFLWPALYSKAYWTFELVHNVLLCFLSAEIIWRLLPRRYVVGWASIASFIPAATLLVRLPLNPAAAALLNFSTSASFTGGILLMSLFFIPVNWTKEYRIATAGVFSVLLADLLSSFGISGYSGANQISAVQLAPLLGLILLSLAGEVKQKIVSLGRGTA
jgi:hypothetical protein